MKKAKHPSLKVRIKLMVFGTMKGTPSYIIDEIGTYKLKNGDAVTIDYDQFRDADSPRDWDNLGTFLTWDEGRQNSPDKNPFYDPEDFFETYNSKNAIIYFVEKYEHGGVAYSLKSSPRPSYKWDSGIVGVMFVPFDKVRKDFGVSNITQSVRDKVKKVLQSEINIYNKWVNGEVYQVVITDKDGEIVESCGGFFSIDEALDGMGIKPSDIVLE